MEKLDVRDDWEEAWGVAAEILKADRQLGMNHQVTVRPVTVSIGRKRSRRVWGIFLLDGEGSPEMSAS